MTSEQVRLIPGEDPDDVVGRAKAEHQPIKTFCLFSGGGDTWEAFGFPGPAQHGRALFA